MPQRLRMWVVYDHPSDCPDSFIARLWEMNEEGVSSPTQSYVQSQALKMVREQMLQMGLVCLHRSPEDDEKIVEVWI